MPRAAKNKSIPIATIGIETDFGPEHADIFRRDLCADYVPANSSARKANNPEMARPRLK